MKSQRSARAFYATETIYIKQVLDGTLKLAAAVLLTAALLISGI